MMKTGGLHFNTGLLERLFKPPVPPLIGADISSSGVKLIEISAAGKSVYRIERYVIEPLPRDAVVDGNIMNLDVVSDCLKRGWKRLGSRIKNVALALPTSAVITKKITVPAGQDDDELELQVETEANQYIPFALDEVNLDFQVIGPAPDRPDEVEVLIAASRKEKVEDRVAAAESAGLRALVMDVEVYAAQAAVALVQKGLQNGGHDCNIAVVDVGTAMMNVNILRNNESIYTREQSFGGHQLTQEIQNRYGLSLEEAESAKRLGGLPDTYRTEVLAPFMDTLGLEVARALQHFYASTQHTKVDHILLAGGCSAIPGIDEVVTRRTQINTVIANPFSNMALGPRVKPRNLSSDAPALMIACGLALRRFTA